MDSPFTGLALKRDLEGKRPIAVMIDGSLKALPQAGLQDASMVFSSPIEAGINRYSAIFLDNMPALAGPIRSARPYFIDWALAYQPFFVHCGGSPEAVERLRREKALIDLDYIYLFNESGKQVPLTMLDFFKRRNDRTSPHNLYIDIKRLREGIDLGQAKSVNPGIPFKLDREVTDFSAYESIGHKDGKADRGDIADSIDVIRGGNNSVSYRYQRDINRYRRYFIEDKAAQGGSKPHIDENSGKALEIDNLVLMRVDCKPIPGDLKGRVAIKTLDRGKALFFLDGKGIKGSWLKINYDMAIRFFDDKGKRVLFNPGNIWIEIMFKEAEVKMGKKVTHA